MPAQPQSGLLRVRIGSRTYASHTQQASLGEASTVNGVLRTRAAYIDSSVVLAAFNLFDASHNVRVQTSGLRVVLQLSHVGSSLSRSQTCDTGRLHQSADHYSGSCRIGALSQDWFAAGGTAQASHSRSLRYRAQRCQRDHALRRVDPL